MKDRTHDDTIGQPPERIKLGSLLASIARETGGLTDEEAEHFSRLRDKAPAEPMRFECQGGGRDVSGKFLPLVDNPTKVSTAMCATVFEELDSALVLMHSVRGEFNPLQRQLIGRFIAACKVFGRDMLTADGNHDALREMFGFSATCQPSNVPDPLATGQALIDEVCTGVCADLERIGTAVQGELLEGVIDVMADVRSAQEPESPESEALDAMASSVRHLAHQVAALFETQPYALRRHQLAYQADIEATDGDPEATPRVTVEEFMQSAKPPVRPPTLRERLGPYIPQLTQLRDQGYTYAQCAQFLHENGIKTYPAAISSVLWEVRR